MKFVIRWKWFIIPLTLVVFLTIFRIIKDRNPTTINYVSFRNCKIEYLQYHKGYKELYEGHALYNEDLQRQANQILANRLLDEFLLTKDSTLPKEIVRIANQKYPYQPNKNYTFDEILNDRVRILDTLILID